jgi:hypothetical protein
MMGAMSFMHLWEGANHTEGFRLLAERSRIEDGNLYSGEIGMKSGSQAFCVVETVDQGWRLAEALINEDADVVREFVADPSRVKLAIKLAYDKWSDNCVAIKVEKTRNGNPGWIFVGTSPS